MRDDEREKRPAVALATLGCKVNQFESAAFRSGLEGRDVELVPFSGPADIYIINTCAVTGKAGAQSRQLIRRAMRANPEARLVVTGCYAQVAAQEILEITDQPVCIVGNGHKHLLVDIALSGKQCDLEMHMGDISRQKEICPLPVHRFEGRTRAYLKVQDGCNRFCTYCIVPYARGRSRSLMPGKALAQLDRFVDQGYKEVVLTGIHLGMYGQDLVPQLRLLDLLALLERQHPALRYRLSSLEPTEITAEILQLMAGSENFMPYLHIPLQSGDDQILRQMNRRYAAADFARVVEQSIRSLPGVAIGVDVLVGFPGENGRAFENTLRLLEALPVAYLHVFPYSRRPGTVAAGLPDQVPNRAKEERVALLRQLDHNKRTAFYARHIGSVQRVLAEGNTNRLHLMKGFTENYIPVYFEAPEGMTNQIVDVKIERQDGHKVYGRMLKKKAGAAGGA